MEYRLETFDRIYLDFDGPVLDCRARHHRVFVDVMLELGAVPVRLPDVGGLWKRKREGESTAEIGLSLLPESSSREIEKRWLERIELDDYLDLDVLQPGARDVLTVLRRAGRDVRLITARQDEEGVYHQLAQLGLEHYFENVIVCGYHAGMESKHGPLHGDLEDFRGGACLVGDTEMDMSAAEACGLVALGVECGIREADVLREAGARDVRPSLEAYLARSPV